MDGNFDLPIVALPVAATLHPVEPLQLQFLVVRIRPGFLRGSGNGKGHTLTGGQSGGGQGFVAVDAEKGGQPIAPQIHLPVGGVGDGEGLLLGGAAFHRREIQRFLAHGDGHIAAHVPVVGDGIGHFKIAAQIPGLQGGMVGRVGVGEVQAEGGPVGLGVHIGQGLDIQVVGVARLQLVDGYIEVQVALLFVLVSLDCDNHGIDPGADEVEAFVSLVGHGDGLGRRSGVAVLGAAQVNRAVLPFAEGERISLFSGLGQVVDVVVIGVRGGTLPRGAAADHDVGCAVLLRQSGGGQQAQTQGQGQKGG